MTASTAGAPESPSALQRRKLTLCVALAVAMPARAATVDLTTVDMEQLMQLTVVSAAKYEQQQSEVAAAASIITRQEIQAFGWRTLGEALASLPGLYTTYDRQYTYLGARGFGLPGDFNTRVLLTIDGNRVNDPLYDGAAFGREFPLDLDLVERIEYIPGPGGSVYGQNAMYGVVNVITRTGADLGGTELAAAYQGPQSLREGRASWGTVLDNDIDVLVSASGMRSRGQDNFHDFGSAGVSGVAAGLDGERNRQFLARAARGPWAVEFVQGDRRKDDPTAAYLSDPLVPGQYERDRYSLAQLQYQDRDADNALQVAGRLFAGQQRFRSVFVYGGVPIASPAISEWHGAELRLVSAARADHKLMLGLEYQGNARIDQAVLDPSQPANDIHISAPGYRAGVFAQDEWRLAGSLTTTLGLRIDRNDVTGTALSPRAALIWQATPATTLKALYGKAHRAPNAFESKFDDGVSQVANTRLQAEVIDTRELVADHRIGRDLALRASVYEWSLHDLILLGIDPVSGLTQYQSSGGVVKARGLELSADKTWGGGARLRGNLSLQDVNAAGGTGLPNSPKLLARLNLSGPLPVAGLLVGYELRYDGPRRTVAGAEQGGYAVSNLHLGTQVLAKGLDLSLGIQNLFDKRYAQPAAGGNWQDVLAQDGRSARVMLRYRY
ncbi:TonB-dependent receptor plug domain-containing protein [Methylibium sp.]|uniref:TonB-dependent receptor plug domain-containing protein n=1 Tax=Methylibium sp. TaxID=2067992 RepID=UPI003D09693A